MTKSLAVIFDLEFTAWEGSMQHGWLRPGEFKEVVQIGAVKVDANTLDILDGFAVIVRPRINACLSIYLQNLTGITNKTVKAEGRDFLQAYDAFLTFANGASISSFGRDDLVLMENLRLYGISSVPPMPQFHDSRPWFRANGIETRGLHSCDIGPLLGVPFEGRKHDALADSRSIATGMQVLVSRGARSPFA